jgi:hypothetical protein
MTYTALTDDDLRRIYATTTTIAVVGASTDPDKAGHYIPEYLKGVGYQVIPVNPNAEQIWGVKAYPSLQDIPEDVAIDVVDVFRPSEETPDIARSAVARGASVLWLQEGIYSEEAADIASAGGLEVVMDKCMGATHRRLFR